MENWDNLNIYLTKASEESRRNEFLSKELIKYCLKNEKETVKEILKKGAPINCNDEHITPLIACIQNDNLSLGYYLLKAGSRISYKPNANFEDAFWFSLRNKKYDFLSVFVEQRCLLEWNIPKNDKESPQTPLIFATVQSDLKAVEILLSHYAIKVNQRDGLGNTALHYNISKQEMTQDDIEIGRLLIAAGADTSIVNLDGKTPEDLAQDFAARSVLLSGKLEQELPKKEEVIGSDLSDELTIEDDLSIKEETPNNGVSMTKKGKMKI